MPKIQSEWDAFESMAVASDAGPTQRSEMRRAFFSGAYAVLAILGNSGQEIDRRLWAKLFGEAHRFGVEQMRRDAQR